MVTARRALAALALLGASAAPAGSAALATSPASPAPAAGAGEATPAPAALVVLGLENRVEKKAWRDRRLGVGLRGRLAQMCADSGAFTLIEEKDLAPALRDALGGYWLREKSAEELADLAGLHRSTGAEWIVHGSLDEVGVTRDRVTGIVGGRRWAYRVAVRLCLHAAGGAELCEEGTGRSTTTVVGAVVTYRGDEVAFDQAGPAEAADRALVDAFNRLMPRWEERATAEAGR